MTPLRIGCVPYLNGKPLIDWFHSPECDVAATIRYAVPSALAELLAVGDLDVALVSVFELFRSPGLQLVPGIGISADGPVKSVRLFSQVPFHRIRTIALDTSSLTSAALVQILLRELHGVSPCCLPYPPELATMLATCDAGLIIGDLNLFDTPARYIMDLGEAWKELTAMPFVYAAWLAGPETDLDASATMLGRARDWGVARLEELSVKWSQRMSLPLGSVRGYFACVMQYDLIEPKLQALAHFRLLCERHGLV